jgi:HAD superfamily hydrolase (TIGR01549 family)
MPRFETILFDLGSTLIYFDGNWPEVLAEADHDLIQSLQRSGLQLDEQDFLAEFHSRLEAYFSERDSEFIEYTTAYLLRSLLEERGYSDLPDSILRPAIEARYTVSQAHWHVEDDAIATLSGLRQKGYRLGMISNASDDLDVQVLVDKAGVRSFFEVILSSAALGIRKPNPHIFQTVLQLMNVLPSRAAMVGDMLGADILGARNAGIYSIWNTRRADTAANRAHEDTILPDATITKLSELPPLLEILSKI